MTIDGVRFPSGIRGTTPFLVILCSVFGVRFLLKGVRGDILDDSGIPKAPRWLYFAGGIGLQIPLVLYAYALRVAN